MTVRAGAREASTRRVGDLNKQLSADGEVLPVGFLLQAQYINARKPPLGQRGGVHHRLGGRGRRGARRGRRRDSAATPAVRCGLVDGG
jgi:hypothetical protein